MEGGDRHGAVILLLASGSGSGESDKHICSVQAPTESLRARGSP